MILRKFSHFCLFGRKSLLLLQLLEVAPGAPSPVCVLCGGQDCHGAPGPAARQDLSTQQSWHSTKPVDGEGDEKCNKSRKEAFPAQLKHR